MALEQKVKVRLEADTSQANRALDQSQSRFGRFASFLKARFVVTLGDAQRAISAIFQAIEDTGKLENQTAALRRNLALQGQSFDEYIAKLKEVSDNQVSTAELIQSSSRALLLGIPAEEIAKLLEIARVSSLATGESVAKAFADITLGIGRSSPLILDNLGIVVNLTQAHEAMAQQIGKSTEELTAQEKRTALLNQVLQVGEERVRDFGDAQTELSKATNKGTAALQNFTAGAKAVVSTVGTALASIVTRSAAGFVSLGEVVVAVTAELSKLLSALPVVGEFFSDLAQSALRVERGLRDTRKELLETADALSEVANTRAAVLLGLRDETDETDNNTAALGRNTTARGLNTTAVRTNAEASEQARVADEDWVDVINSVEQAFTGSTSAVVLNTSALRENAVAADTARVAEEQLESVKRQSDDRFTRNFITGDRSDIAQIGGGQFSVGTTTRKTPGRGFNRV